MSLCPLSPVAKPLLLTFTALSRGPFRGRLWPDVELRVVGRDGRARVSVKGLEIDLGVIVVACAPII